MPGGNTDVGAPGQVCRVLHELVGADCAGQRRVKRSVAHAVAFHRQPRCGSHVSGLSVHTLSRVRAADGCIAVKHSFPHAIFVYRLFKRLLMNKVEKVALHALGNFVVQRALASCPSADAAKLLGGELFDSIEDLFAHNRRLYFVVFCYSWEWNLFYFIMF